LLGAVVDGKTRVKKLLEGKSEEEREEITYIKVTEL
jgi:hypothetical protein